jgi:hypothetical protein
MFKKDYTIETIKENEVYNITAHDNGDEIIHKNVSELEMLSLIETYELNGFIKGGK